MAITKYFSLKILIFAPKFMFHLKYIKIMTTNEMILQAQITSLRRVADVLLLHFWSDAENKTQLIWFSRYLNYKQGKRIKSFTF